MCNLRLEELERRELLNGTGFFVQAPHGQPAGGACAGPAAGHSALVSFRGSPVEEANAQRAAPAAAEGQGPEAVVISIVISPLTPTAAGPAQPETPGAGLVPAGAGLPSPGPAPATAAEPSTPPPPSPGLPSLAAALGFGALVQGFSAAYFPVHTVSGAEGASLLADWPSPRPPSTSPGGTETPAPTAPQPEQGAERVPLPLPAPPLSGLLAVLPPIDLQELELELHQFLRQLGEAAPRLPWQGQATGVSYWIVAAAGAVTACALALRQVRRPEVRRPRETIDLGPLTSDF